MYDDMKETLESLRNNLESLEQEERSLQRKPQPLPPAVDLTKRMSANDAVQGMMWAEVFGPPRSKKPFRWSHRYE